MIVLPYQYKARDYQQEVIKAFFEDGYKRFINVWHRRAGKDKTWNNILIGAAMQRVGMYVYTFPTLTQARRVIWEGRDKDGVRFLDHFPRDLISGVNNSDMKLTLSNGSIIRFGGTDYYDSWMGTNPVGVIFSEYSLQNPLAWDLIRPILSENGGWASFIYTPRGGNHAYDLYVQNRDNPEWFVSMKTVEDTFDFEGKRAISEKAVEAERAAGMSQDMIDQEFYCSFEAALKGAYYSNQLRYLRENDRLIDFEIDDRMVANRFYDIGHRDHTAIWTIQSDILRNRHYIIDYYEKNNERLKYFVEENDRRKKQLGICIRKDYFPHDAANESLIGSLEEEAKSLGLNCEVVPCIDNVLNGIELCRVILPKCIMHSINCRHGIECLKSYHKKYYDKKGIYGLKPNHDWASHGADAFRTFAQALELGLLADFQNSPSQTFQGRVNVSRL